MLKGFGMWGKAAEPVAVRSDWFVYIPQPWFRSRFPHLVNFNILQSLWHPIVLSIRLFFRKFCDLFVLTKLSRSRLNILPRLNRGKIVINAFSSTLLSSTNFCGLTIWDLAILRSCDLALFQLGPAWPCSHSLHVR